MNPSRMRLGVEMGLWPSTQMGCLHDVHTPPAPGRRLASGVSTETSVRHTPQLVNPKSPTAPDLACHWTKQACHPTFQQGTSLSKISQQVCVEPGLQPGSPAARFGLIPHLGCPNPQGALTLPSETPAST